jgi:selenocysteine-specific elongation factor
MHVIGTAGHVDHGKTALTYALTQIQTDRLEEERQREMTIDLGFAWLDLPNGERVGIVDVPGHRDFIENMLAGVGGIDAAILVIAADEGVMPQTREHLAILDLLGVPSGLIALTKIDLVPDRDWLELVQLDILDAVQDTVLEGRPIIPVSARTGEGLGDLIASLTDLLEHLPPRPDVGQPRLPIDRVFTISGFGVVVTGTLTGGGLSVGQEVEIQPAGVRARIRGLQSHEQQMEHVERGQRVAVNLRGVEKSDLARGDVLGLPGAWHPTTLIDARLRYLPEAHRPLEHDDEVKLFIGAAEVMAHVRLLDRDQVLPGEESWVQIRLERSVVAAPGDRYIIRRASPAETVGGGVILDTAPGRRWKRHRPEVIARFATLASGDPLAIALLKLSDARGPVRVESLGLSDDQIAQAAQRGDLLLDGQGWALHPGAWARLADRARRVLARFHAAEPQRLGLPPESLRSRLRLEPETFAVALDWLVREGVIVPAEGGAVRLPEHTVRLSAAQEDALARLRRAFAEQPHTPPTVQQAREMVGDALLNSLIERGELVPISSEVVLAPDVLAEWAAFARERLERGEPLNVGVLRDHFGTTRRYAIDFLERLDALNITRRRGDDRVRGPGDWSRLGRV